MLYALLFPSVVLAHGLFGGAANIATAAPMLDSAPSAFAFCLYCILFVVCVCLHNCLCWSLGPSVCALSLVPALCVDAVGCEVCHSLQ